ncbi:MAG: hypothetical protein IRZ16_14580 [Myxococcaceae bacterium]|nr:hypothetical protein [Myxococcaceae bacterium]
MPEPTSPLQNLPPRDGDAPLHELTLDQLSVFLYIAFTGEELLELLRGIGAALKGGYRLESLQDAERADVLAGELRDYPKLRKKVIEKLAEIYEFPALDGVVLPPAVAEEIALLAVQHDATVRMIWRLLADPSPEVRKTSALALDALVADYYGPPPGQKDVAGKPAPAPAAAPAPKPAEDPDLKELKKEARRAGAMAERARERATNLKEQLREARAEISRLEREAASKAKESARLAAELERAREKLAEARKKKGHEEFEKLEKERAELKSRVGTLEEKVRALVEERTKLEEQLAAVARQSAQRPAEPVKPAAEVPEPPVEELPATWLFPRFTREFYDSLERWDPRIQRTAFKQAFLLAENHRHPSLRAIPLEGIPGYYRVRIATDVRLIYRRSENEREVEILSLIDREDLDRYVRQAKTR